MSTINPPEYQQSPSQPPPEVRPPRKSHRTRVISADHRRRVRCPHPAHRHHQRGDQWRSAGGKCQRASGLRDLGPSSYTHSGANRHPDSYRDGALFNRHPRPVTATAPAAWAAPAAPPADTVIAKFYGTAWGNTGSFTVPS